MAGLSVHKKAPVLAAIAILLLLLYVFNEATARLSLPINPSREVSTDSRMPRADGEEPTQAQRIRLPARTTAALNVLLVFVGDGSPAGEFPVTLQPLNPEGKALVAYTSDAGSCHFRDLSPGYYRVHTAFGTHVRLMLRAGDDRKITLSLREGLTIEGTVISREREAVAGAQVFSYDHPYTMANVPLAVADHAGRFRLPSVPVGSRLYARAVGWSPSLPVTVEGSPNSQARVSLYLARRGHRLEGLIIDRNGVPMPFARVGVAIGDWKNLIHLRGLRRLLPSADFKLRRHTLLTEADNKGRFAIDEVSTGHQLVVAVGIGKHAGKRGFVMVNVAGRHATTVRVRLDTNAEISGMVTDAHHQPVTGIELRAQWLGTNELGELVDPTGRVLTRATTQTDTRGHYTLAGLLPGSYLVCVGEHGSAAQSQVELAWGERSLRDLCLQTPRVLRLRLLGPDGQALINWRVLPRDRNRDQHPGDASLMPGDRTDARGCCSLALRGREGVDVIFLPPTTASECCVPGVVRRGLRHTDAVKVLRFSKAELPSASVQGRLVDARGRPITGARIRFRVAEWPDDFVCLPDAITGAFVVGPLPPGVYTFSVCADHHVTQDFGPFQLAASENRVVGDLLVPDPASLRVQVLGPGTADGIVVSLENERGGTRTLDPIHPATFEAGLLRPGAYTLVMFGPAAAPRRLPVKLPSGKRTQTSVWLDAAPTLTLRIRSGLQPISNLIPIARLEILHSTGEVMLREDLCQDSSIPIVRRYGLVPGEYQLVLADIRTNRRVETHVQVLRTGASKTLELKW